MKEQITLEPYREGRPNEGRVFACIYPHSDDFSLDSACLMTKLIAEGYTGYLIRTTNDELDSYSLTPGECMHKIEGEMHELCRALGIRKLYDFNYKNHYMDFTQLTEIRHRLITLFRYLKVDTVISFDPNGQYEENPDHYITALAVEQACWMAACRNDLPETIDMGLEPQNITRKYLFARGAQIINRIIDTNAYQEQRFNALMCNYSPMYNMFMNWNASSETKYPDLASFVRGRIMRPKSELEGLTNYEKYHYIGD